MMRVLLARMSSKSSFMVSEQTVMTLEEHRRGLSHYRCRTLLFSEHCARSAHTRNFKGAWVSSVSPDLLYNLTISKT